MAQHTVKWDRLPQFVRKDLKEMYEDLHSEEETKLIVEQFSPKQVFKTWLEYNGILGYATQLYDLPQQLEAACDIKLATTYLGDGEYAVRPEGCLGTCGWKDGVAWEVQYVKAATEEEAINIALTQQSVHDTAPSLQGQVRP